MHILKYRCFGDFCRRLCRRSDRFAVCVLLLPPALPPLPAHGLPPALRQSGQRRPRALASTGRPAAHWQCHHPPPGGLDWRSSMTSGHHRDYPQHPHEASKPTSPPLVTGWLSYTFKWTLTPTPSYSYTQSRWHTFFFRVYSFKSGSCSAAMRVYI